MDLFLNGKASRRKTKSPNQLAHQEEIDAIVSGVSNQLSLTKANAASAAIDGIIDSDEDDNDIFEDPDEDSLMPSMSGTSLYKTPPSSTVSAPASMFRSSPTAQSNALATTQQIRKSAGTSSTREEELSSSAETDGDDDSSDDDTDDDSDDDDEDDDDDDDHDDDDDDSSRHEKKAGNASDSAEDYTDDDDEGQDGYKAGGYHPVKVGEVYNQRYVVIKKLGWGHFSTVWMVKDRKVVANAAGQTTTGAQFYALKVQKSAEHYTEAAMDEVELLDCVASERKQCEASANLDSPDPDGVTAQQIVDHSKHVAILHDSFFHTGPNGRHMCMVFSMLGCNLLSVIKAYNYRGIPISVVKRMIAGICKGLDFLHRKCKIIHTDLKPENVLLQYPSQMALEQPLSKSLPQTAETKRNPMVMTIEELEAALKDPSLSTDERRQVRNRLKKKRLSDKCTSIDEQDGSDEEIDGINRILSDREMEQMLMMNSDMDGTSGERSSSRVVRRLSHSMFVFGNFGRQQVSADSRLMQIMTDRVTASRPSASELDEHLVTQEKNGQGVANIVILLRTYTPEEELADTVTEALHGIKWERSGRPQVTREWRCSIALANPGEEDVSTMFRLSQKSRKDVDQKDRQVYTDLVQLLGANMVGDAGDGDMPELSMGITARANRSLPFSVFTIELPVSSTYVIFAYLESRLPGVMFMTYKREEGDPQLDSVVFGNSSKILCDHPMAMKIKDDGRDPSTVTSLGTCMLGFDLRLVKEFAARPSAGVDGHHSFELGGQSMESVAQWWAARNHIQDRVRSFLGVDPTTELIDVPGMADTKLRKNPSNGNKFIEGGKVIPKEELSMEALVESTKDALERASYQPDLKDAAILSRCRAVVVDLGNACWTHRHFSEDIQTRQYRAPEVLIGSNYDTSADIWSLGCICFELLTGDLLFDPRAGEDYDRDEDHLAMFQELLGKMPKRLSVNGKFSKNFFDRKGNLKHIKQLKFWPIEDVLCEKYHFDRADAEAVASFMKPLLEFDTEKRATALQALRHPWLQEYVIG
uniref:non-specific serine/threonine protein kinase n=1 Tax=Grammatophora oceanica TaxID=210454 RepID=A0A7S1Y3V4_9STRA|mmetsp:Transcript_17468/g.25839  ORF Transcript_17468/g.25839 Transcript_17468/m.25839 type:complete len:1040 (+) Transcript_17468:419-3538(+)|eukprot:CAMPEP_0194032080 /NCGR_PEP_ID=MMETSP0009_2-20130614/5108_1 /TAXON_ID=210454 /ORGANISM="Grammatophora oceanica, Strain CCMP 410" /LENGTH=1039 /DNA_ID=CAMNT_0038672421 /DNA_START=380 /DNA_END=3499 /DNA_ORIENTATION=+